MFAVGDKVSLKKKALEIPYIKARSCYTDIYKGKTGTVLGYSGTGKVAVEFDDIVFTGSKYKQSSHDNGCHGKGKLHYCWYIPEECLKLLSEEHYNFDLLLIG